MPKLTLCRSMNVFFMPEGGLCLAAFQHPSAALLWATELVATLKLVGATPLYCMLYCTAVHMPLGLVATPCYPCAPSLQHTPCCTPPRLTVLHCTILHCFVPQADWPEELLEHELCEEVFIGERPPALLPQISGVPSGANTTEAPTTSFGKGFGAVAADPAGLPPLGTCPAAGSAAVAAAMSAAAAAQAGVPPSHSPPSNTPNASGTIHPPIKRRPSKRSSFRVASPPVSAASTTQCLTLERSQLAMGSMPDLRVGSMLSEEQCAGSGALPDDTALAPPPALGPPKAGGSGKGLAAAAAAAQVILAAPPALAGSCPMAAAPGTLPGTSDLSGTSVAASFVSQGNLAGGAPSAPATSAQPSFLSYHGQGGAPRTSDAARSREVPAGLLFRGPRLKVRAACHVGRGGSHCAPGLASQPPCCLTIADRQCVL